MIPMMLHVLKIVTARAGTSPPSHMEPQEALGTPREFSAWGISPFMRDFPCIRGFPL